MLNQYLNWKTERDADNVLWLLLDKVNASVNSINEAILDELEVILDQLDENKPAGIVFGTAKNTGFIAGADIERFRQFSGTDEAKQFVERGQQLLNRIENLPIPTVAMIEGFCLGGGCELALACTYRIAENGPKTRIGLPEVLLGIQPGWGGSYRLTRLIGAMNALPLMLEGRTVDARKAAKLGLIDAEVPKRQLQRAAAQFILKKPAKRKATFIENLSNHKLVRPILAYFIKKKLQAKVKSHHYPAPYAMVDNWLKFGTSLPEAAEAETRSILDLISHETAKNLIRVFSLREKMRSLGKDSVFKAEHVHVIGAGTMGGDIAAWCALKGLTVTLQDREPKFIAPAIKRAYNLFKSKLKEDRLVELAMDRLQPDVNGYGVKQADVIIEAIYENLEAKQSLLKLLETNAKPTAIIASNTSSIPLDEMNVVMQNPERLVGIHFFNPVAKMELVEVVYGAKTSDLIKKNALAFVKQIDRSPLPVTSTPGFLVNRILMPYLLESIKLFEEGVPAAVIDKTAKSFGMPMGPVELADTVGLDICLSVAENLTKYYGGDVPGRLKQMVQEGLLGRKSGKGFYTYKNGKPQKNMPKDYQASHDIQDRMIMRYLNEAMACLREGVVSDAELLDAGMIFGTGFAPFRGGPMHYAHEIGMSHVRQRLEDLAKIYGGRFTPDAGWSENLSNENKTETTTH